MIINFGFADKVLNEIVVESIKKRFYIYSLEELSVGEYINFKNNSTEEELLKISKKLIIKVEDTFSSRSINLETITDEVRLLVMITLFENELKEKKEKAPSKFTAKGKRKEVKVDNVSVEWKFKVSKFLNFYSYKFEDVYSMRWSLFVELYSMIDAVEAEKLLSQVDAMDASALLTEGKYRELREKILKRIKKDRESGIKIDDKKIVKGFDDIFAAMKGGAL